MKRRILTLALGALVAVPVAALALAGPVMAQNAPVNIDQVGWWTSRADASAGPGGFEIAASFDGSTESLAAIQISVNALAVDTLQISLTDAAGPDAEAGDAGMEVCITTNGWAPEVGGDLENAPEPNCASAIPLELAGGVWSADVASLAPNGGQVSLMIVPDYQPATIIGLGMVVEISAVDFSASGTVPTTTTATTVGGTTPTTSPPTTAAFVPTPITTSSSSTTTEPLAGDLSQSNLPPETIPTPVTSATGDDGFFTLGPAQDFDDGGKPWFRLLFLVPASAMIGFGTVQAKNLLAARAA